MPWIADLVAAVCGYLLGSISFAVVVSRLFGLADPRSYGSRNPGATNVLRSGSKLAAALTLAGDAAKGAVAVWLARRYGAPFGVDEFGVALTGFAAFVGHLYPVFFRFQGGKGVATFLGVVVALNPWLGLAACVVWVLIALFFRYSSLASILAAALTPLFHAFASGFDALLIVLAAMSVLLVIRHKQNIANLMAGTERRIGDKAHALPRARHRG